jgi:VanZ family protein
MTLLRRCFLVAFWAALIFAFVMAVLPKPPALPGAPGDKVQHIIAFVVLTGLARLAYPRARTLTLLLAFALFGALIELTQMLPALGRTAALDDWIADVVATMVVLASGRPRSALVGAAPAFSGRACGPRIRRGCGSRLARRCPP